MLEKWLSHLLRVANSKNSALSESAGELTGFVVMHGRSLANEHFVMIIGDNHYVSFNTQRVQQERGTRKHC